MTGWFRRLLHGRELERQLDAELHDHIERHVADLIRGGISEAEARRQARLSIGGVEQAKEQCRDARGTMWIEHVRRDVAFALRQLRRRPAFWSTVMITLVVGIATTTVEFSILELFDIRHSTFDQ